MKLNEILIEAEMTEFAEKMKAFVKKVSNEQLQQLRVYVDKVQPKVKEKPNLPDKNPDIQQADRGGAGPVSAAGE